jgi:hypothetical protein
VLLRMMTTVCEMLPHALRVSEEHRHEIGVRKDKLFHHFFEK